MFVQGDLRDILHLRKGLLRAVLGHINWKVCLLYSYGYEILFGYLFVLIIILLFLILLMHRCCR